MKQLVYKCERSQPFDAPDLHGAEFRFLTSPWSVLPLLGALRRCLGSMGLVKALLKLATPSRRFYCILADGAIAHYAWASVSFCHYYRVAQGDWVIGPIMTGGRARGRGYATAALKLALNRLMADGGRVFWIDTAEDNVPCRKVIEKCGFGAPVSNYERPAEGL